MNLELVMFTSWTDPATIAPPSADAAVDGFPPNVQLVTVRSPVCSSNSTAGCLKLLNESPTRTILPEPPDSVIADPPVDCPIMSTLSTSMLRLANDIWKIGAAMVGPWMVGGFDASPMTTTDS